MELNLINYSSLSSHGSILQTLCKKHRRLFLTCVKLTPLIGVLSILIRFSIQMVGPISAYTWFTVAMLYFLILVKSEPTEKLGSPQSHAKSFKWFSAYISKTGFTGKRHNVKSMRCSRVYIRARAHRSPRRASFAVTSGSSGDSSGDPDQGDPPGPSPFALPFILIQIQSYRTSLPWLILGCCRMGRRWLA